MAYGVSLVNPRLLSLGRSSWVVVAALDAEH